MSLLALSRHPRWVVAAATAVAAISIERYPGGTPLDATTRGYSLTHNFLSDLGMTVAYNHASNRVGATLFTASLLLLVIGLGSAVATIARYLAEDAGARRWARLAGVSLLFACVAFAGVAVTPENRVMPLHVSFTNWAWRIVPAVAVFLGAASYKRAGLRRRVAGVWFGAALLLAVYVALSSWGPSLETPNGLVVQVIAQKTATIILTLTLLIAAGEVDRASRQAAAA